MGHGSGVGHESLSHLGDLHRRHHCPLSVTPPPRVQPSRLPRRRLRAVCRHHKPRRHFTPLNLRHTTVASIRARACTDRSAVTVHSRWGVVVSAVIRSSGIILERSAINVKCDVKLKFMN